MAFPFLSPSLGASLGVLRAMMPSARSCAARYVSHYSDTQLLTSDVFHGHIVPYQKVIRYIWRNRTTSDSWDNTRCFKVIAAERGTPGTMTVRRRKVTSCRIMTRAPYLHLSTNHLRGATTSLMTGRILTPARGNDVKRCGSSGLR